MQVQVLRVYNLEKESLEKLSKMLSQHCMLGPLTLQRNEWPLPYRIEFFKFKHGNFLEVEVRSDRAT